MKTRFGCGVVIAAATCLAAAPADSQNAVTYTYDALGRVISATYPGGVTTYYTYDQADNRTRLLVQGQNSAPVANPDAAQVSPGNTVSANVRANDTDADGDPIALTAVSTATKGTASIDAGNVKYTANIGASGQEVLTYAISDGRGGAATSTLTITITSGGTNQVPTAVNDTVSTAYQTPITFDPRQNDFDPDGDTLSITSVGSAAHGSRTFTGTSVTYTPSAGYAGGDALTYTISDGKGGTASATAAITVSGVNHPPTAGTDMISTQVNTPIYFSPLGNDTDPDGDTLTIASATNGSHAVTENFGSAITYYAANNYVGPDSFTYVISDGRGGTATGTVNVTVTPPGPVALNDALVATYFYENEDSFGYRGCVNVLSNDTGTNKVVISVGASAYANAYTDGTQVCYVSYFAMSPPETISYTMTADQGSASAGVSITTQ